MGYLFLLHIFHILMHLIYSIHVCKKKNNNDTLYIRFRFLCQNTVYAHGKVSCFISVTSAGKCRVKQLVPGEQSQSSQTKYWYLVFITLSTISVINPRMKIKWFCDLGIRYCDVLALGLLKARVREMTLFSCRILCFKLGRIFKSQKWLVVYSVQIRPSISRYIYMYADTV